MKPQPAPSQPVPVKGAVTKPRTYVDPSSGEPSGGLDNLSPMALSDNLWRLSGSSAPQSSFTRAQSLFLGLEGASEVPETVRSCWAKFDEGASEPSVPREGSAGTNAIDILTSTSPAAWQPALGGELSGASGVGCAGGLEMGPLAEDLGSSPSRLRTPANTARPMAEPARPVPWAVPQTLARSPLGVRLHQQVCQRAACMVAAVRRPWSLRGQRSPPQRLRGQASRMGLVWQTMV